MKVNHVIAAALVVIAVAGAYLAKEKAAEVDAAKIEQQQVDIKKASGQAEARRNREAGKKLFGGK